MGVEEDSRRDHMGNGQIQAVYDAFTAAGWATVLDSHDEQYGYAPALELCPDARWYFGWYKAFFYNDAFQWRPGAVGLHLDSFSAMNYREMGSWVAGALVERRGRLDMLSI